MKAISPQYQQLLGAQRINNLGEIENILEAYFNRIRKPSYNGQPSPASVYASAGGGDPTRNKANEDLVKQHLQQISQQVTSQLQQLRVDVSDAIRSHTAGISAVSMDTTQEKHVTFNDEPKIYQERYGRHTRADRGDNSGDDDETPPRKQPNRFIRPKVNNPKKQWTEKFCRHCKHEGRRCYDTHHSPECYYHPNKDIAANNINNARRQGLRTPDKQSSPYRPQPLTDYKAPAIDMYNPKVRQLVDQQVMMRLNDLQRTVKAADMLREKDAKDDH